MEILRWFVHRWCLSYVWSFGQAANVSAGLAVNVKWTHCIIHHEALASQQLSGDLKRVLEVVIKTVNFIKSRPLKAQLFLRLCDELGSKTQQIIVL